MGIPLIAMVPAIVETLATAANLPAVTDPLATAANPPTVTVLLATAANPPAVTVPPATAKTKAVESFTEAVIPIPTPLAVVQFTDIVPVVVAITTLLGTIMTRAIL